MSLRDEALRRQNAISQERGHPLRMAKKHQGTNIALGLLAGLGGVASILTGLLGDQPWIPGVLGVLAGTAGALQTVLHPQRMAAHHWTRLAGYDRLHDDYSAIVQGPDEPTIEQLNELAARKEALDLPPAE